MNDIEDTSNLPKMKHNSSRGFTVQELIDKLSEIEDKSKFVACPQFGFGGISGVLYVEEETVAGYAGQYSYQKTDVVVLCP